MDKTRRKKNAGTFNIYGRVRITYRDLKALRERLKIFYVKRRAGVTVGAGKRDK